VAKPLFNLFLYIFFYLIQSNFYKTYLSADTVICNNMLLCCMSCLLPYSIPFYLNLIFYGNTVTSRSKALMDAAKPLFYKMYLSAPTVICNNTLLCCTLCLLPNCIPFYQSLIIYGETVTSRTSTLKVRSQELDIFSKKIKCKVNFTNTLPQFIWKSDILECLNRTSCFA
jgi:hypothetical protein